MKPGAVENPVPLKGFHTGERPLARFQPTPGLIPVGSMPCLIVPPSISQMQL